MSICNKIYICLNEGDANINVKWIIIIAKKEADFLQSPTLDFPKLTNQNGMMMKKGK